MSSAQETTKLRITSVVMGSAVGVLGIVGSQRTYRFLVRHGRAEGILTRVAGEESRDIVVSHHFRPRAISMWPPAAIVARQPGGRMVVAVGSSMMAGPVTPA